MSNNGYLGPRLTHGAGIGGAHYGCGPDGHLCVSVATRDHYGGLQTAQLRCFVLSLLRLPGAARNARPLRRSSDEKGRPHALSSVGAGWSALFARAVPA